VLYDLANTIYIATVTFVFTPFAEKVLGGLKYHGIVNFLSMVTAGLLVPFFGALADTTGRSRRYLTVSTLLCIAALGCWHFDLGGLWLLVLFLVANLGYNIALLFYNALLTSVAPAAHAGRISSIGVGVGYLGTIVVAAVALSVKPEPRTMFLLSAGMFLVLALPCLVLVRDRRGRPAADGPGQAATAVREANRLLLRTLRELPRNRPMMWFLAGNFCLADALNTAVLYFAAFTTKVFAAQSATGIELLGDTLVGEKGLEQFVYIAALSLNVIALLVGISVGRWVERAPLAVMRLSAIALLAALAGGTVFGGSSALGYLATLVALGAFGLTCVWSAGRKVIVLLAQPDEIGRYFGLYGITVKLSVIGGVVYGLVNDSFGSKPAMLAQSLQLLLGLACLLMVRLPASTAGDDRA
jgi:UMF1 family MFS transporter